MNYIGQIWRPPSEARSLILQTTVGCSHNKCTFCVMYKEKNFYIKPMEEVRGEIEQASRMYPEVRRIFLADGDAFSMKTDDLLEILELLYQSFPRLTRVTTYAGPKNILDKSVTELQSLKDAGLKMVYLGLESGDDLLLKKVKKGATSTMMVEAGQRLKESGIKTSITVILGLGGQELSQRHAKETARVVNMIQPNYLSALTLMLRPETPLYQQINQDGPVNSDSGKITLLTPFQTVQELFNLISGIEVTDPCIFRSNHASNYIGVAGNFPKDKDQMLAGLKDVLVHPEDYQLKEEWLRGL